ncbi:hypothetical protein [Dictyobacter kobayashii]|uniref:hypothetical protein n=1 Tax=Dictyobacter kobayashii TaxID=2014872 RepID=UPI0013875F5F|nr:hypothetical protein [Dictyobacter kobayashii]
MREPYLTTFAALGSLISTPVLVGAILALAIILLIGGLFLWRSGKKKAVKPPTAANGSSDWQRQAQPGAAGAWNQQGSASNWNQQQPGQGAWNAPGAAGQQNSWGAPAAPAQQQQQPGANPWGAPNPSQASWGAINSRNSSQALIHGEIVLLSQNKIHGALLILLNQRPINPGVLQTLPNHHGEIREIRHHGTPLRPLPLPPRMPGISHNLVLANSGGLPPMPHHSSRHQPLMALAQTPAGISRSSQLSQPIPGVLSLPTSHLPHHLLTRLRFLPGKPIKAASVRMPMLCMAGASIMIKPCCAHRDHRWVLIHKWVEASALYAWKKAKSLVVSMKFVKSH